MKKFIYLMAFVLTTSLMLSCSSDDDGGSTSSDPIVGNWKMTDYIIDGTTFPVENEPCDDIFYKFNSSGTGKITEKYCDDASDIIDFTWEKSGSVYTIIEEFEEITSYEVAFSNDNKKMTLFSDSSSDFGEVFQKQ